MAFTQGLAFDEGVLYEGTGLRGRSTLREVDLESGEVLRSIALSGQFFGEGIAVYGNKIVQLSWTSNTGFVYDKDSLMELQQFSYATQGWGITYDGFSLIMSDGTDVLRFLDPESLQETGRLEVREEDTPVTRLNELEFIQGEIFANVWQTDHIARISPDTGQVLAWIDLTGLLPPEDRGENVGVLNGIAYDAVADRLFVTGKLWPRLFEITLIPFDEGR